MYELAHEPMRCPRARELLAAPELPAHEEDGKLVLFARAAQLLGASLEVEENLLRLATLGLDRVADFCVIDLVDEDGEIHRLTAVARDPAKKGLAERLAAIRLDRDRVHLAFEAIVLGKALFREDLDEASLAQLAQDPMHRALLEELKPRSLIAVPIRCDRIAGAILFFASGSGRRLSTEDLGFATELARLAGAAIANARRFRAERRAHEARDEMLATVAHDLANPLNTVQLSAQSALRQAVVRAPELSRHLELVCGAAKQTIRLVQDLLDFSRLGSGQLSIRCGPCPLDALVDEAVALARPQAQGVELLAEHPPLPNVWADRDRVFQVLGNLIGNALKFTPAGGTVRLSAEVTEQEVEIRVVDTGIGIPEHCLPLVFERFWQATRGDRRGAGLGLTIAKELVEAQGGRLWAKSALGKGSTFAFSLPRHPQPR